jgi:hypothetical protein
MNYYIYIEAYHKTHPNIFKSISGDLKKGYIMMCVYYALKFQIDLNELVQRFPENYHYYSLMEADKNMNIIFGDKLPKQAIQICGEKELLENFGEKLLQNIRKVLEHTSFVGDKYIAAIIYYLTNITFENGGVIAKRLKFKNGTRVTLDSISRFCGISEKTISKYKDEIVNFYKNHQDLLQFFL